MFSALCYITSCMLINGHEKLEEKYIFYLSFKILTWVFICPGSFQ